MLTSYRFYRQTWRNSHVWLHPYVRHVGSSSAVVGSPMKPETLARKIVPLQGEDYDEKNERLQRPLAPHLTIHKLQNNMVLSISHRFTGMILTSLTVGLASCALLPAPFGHYIEVLQEMHPSAWILMAGKLLITLPFAYHYINGIRHLVWDLGRVMEMKQVDRTGNLVVLLAVVLACHLALM